MTMVILLIGVGHYPLLQDKGHRDPIYDDEFISVACNAAQSAKKKIYLNHTNILLYMYFAY